MNIQSAIQDNTRLIFDAIYRDELKITSSWFDGWKITVKKGSALSGSVGLDLFLEKSKIFATGFQYSQSSAPLFPRRKSYYQFFENLTIPSENFIVSTIKKIIKYIQSIFSLKKNSNQSHNLLDETSKIREQFLWFDQAAWDRHFQGYTPEKKITINGSTISLRKIKYVDFEEFLRNT